MLTEQNSFVFSYVMDPSEMMDFRPGFQLETDEQISSFILTVDAASAALGMSVETGIRQPILVEEGTKVYLWISIDEAKRADPAFDTGALLGFTLTVTTTNQPFRRYERNFAFVCRQGGK